VLGRVAGAMREEVTRDWRKVHSEKLHNLYLSLNILRMHKAMKLTGHEAVRIAYKSIFEKSEGKRRSGDTRVKKKKKNSVVLVRKRTIPTERPQPVGEVSANFS
jgi:hypothetical protein